MPFSYLLDMPYSENNFHRLFKKMPLSERHFYFTHFDFEVVSLVSTDFTTDR